MRTPFGAGRHTCSGSGGRNRTSYREMLKIAWENRDQRPFARRILSDGVCDGCALGTSGLSDATVALEPLPAAHPVGL